MITPLFSHCFFGCLPVSIGDHLCWFKAAYQRPLVYGDTDTQISSDRVFAFCQCGRMICICEMFSLLTNVTLNIVCLQIRLWNELSTNRIHTPIYVCVNFKRSVGWSWSLVYLITITVSQYSSVIGMTIVGFWRQIFTSFETQSTPSMLKSGNAPPTSQRREDSWFLVAARGSC